MDKKIDITTSIFTIKPTIRFSQTMNVDKDFWEDMWYRYHNLGYSKLDLKEWFEYKNKRTISIKTVGRWVHRQMLYNAARMAVRRGAKEVSIDYFKYHCEEPIDIVDLDSYLLQEN